ncbi:DNA cytosine methyltransferase [Gaoshiqia sediminis]|uniref:DNA (cytosine-5-)-methyltransferase n=1 Tax=Gaoshiqia sediminis TaxID=2986998 RepID=A0AA41Y0S6_9BACT|nr:DNA cytosine methyltransferase [Gaoshiqia sediminis]MCW0481356.1 DNA cytosine methyltransferase [Gaoshiqia sediminis]
MPQPTVIDFFCGAGGFSEGFRQHGFIIKGGYDYYRPAIDTFNHNFGLNLSPKNILDFEISIEEILQVPDSTVILGSPPCVSFSNSNKSGKADKSMGLRLTESFLRVIAVKKFQPGSHLKAWLMENVPNSLKYIKEYYSFKDLNLSDWARSIGQDPQSIAITIKGNSAIINSADYGSPQIRKRAITGEVINENSLIIPVATHRGKKKKGTLPSHRTLQEIRAYLPSPFDFPDNELIFDPSYDISIPSHHLSDHFYDTGLYECEWKNSEFLKLNHPYMGRMSFPENEGNPSRTICATNIGTSRESIIYRSEYRRIGDGEFRTHTVREAACLMGFPITYQFSGASTSKLRLVGNAVCPAVSRSFARVIRNSLDLDIVEKAIVQEDVNLKGILNLNSSERKIFEKLPIKRTGARFRRHPFKYGNITVTLSNYDISGQSKSKKWLTSVQYGNGDGFPSENYPDNYFALMEKTIAIFNNGREFINRINNGFSERVADAMTLQEMYERRKGEANFLEPTQLVETVAKIIDEFHFDEEEFIQEDESLHFRYKRTVPKKQVLALYAINKISSIANSSN